MARVSGLGSAVLMQEFVLGQCPTLAGEFMYANKMSESTVINSGKNRRNKISTNRPRIAYHRIFGLSLMVLI